MMNTLRYLIPILLLAACSSIDKVDIPVESCNSPETVEMFKVKTRDVLSKISQTSSNFSNFSKMEMVRCTGFDYPAGEGPICAKKCRPYQLGNLTEKSDAVEVALAHFNNELMVVEVAWVPGAMAAPTDAPPKKLESGGLLPGKKSKSKE